MEAMKIIIEAFVARIEAALYHKGKDFNQRNFIWEKILNETQKATTQIEGEEPADFMIRVGNYMKQFENTKKTIIEGKIYQKLSIHVNPIILSELIMRYTTILEEQGEGKEPVELAKHHEIAMTDLEKKLQDKLNRNKE